MLHFVPAPMEMRWVCSFSLVRDYTLTQPSAHNSYAVSTDVAALSVNQNVDVTAQPNLGVRLLQAAGKLKEVVTLILTNGDALDANQYWRKRSPECMAHTRFNDFEWQTTCGHYGLSYKFWRRTWIITEFNNLWETPFSQIDANFPCKVDRVNGSPNGKMYMINHSLNYKFLGSGDIIVPDRAKAPTTNSVASIMAHARGCAPLGEGLWPTYVLLDWVDKGDPWTALKQFNRV
ncbi:PLC-like phosphodiesterase [Rhizoctonia solani]|uniref:PLC-like phosphodiesterase n=1 Tax=Rhizoctonia solani TaxID=456999 RepID=A0A8H7I989_9AGAM|nr:PLC-like phosphodiesterase [Rhizoctonia solani]